MTKLKPKLDSVRPSVFCRTAIAVSAVVHAVKSMPILLIALHISGNPCRVCEGLSKPIGVVAFFTSGQ
jgi:hypothetical protein